MKKRPKGFLAHLFGKASQERDREVGSYVQELHEYLWRVVRVARPGAGGNLNQCVDKAIEELEKPR